jgi:phospholipase/carboxylesterase
MDDPPSFEPSYRKPKLNGEWHGADRESCAIDRRMIPRPAAALLSLLIASVTPAAAGAAPASLTAHPAPLQLAGVPTGERLLDGGAIGYFPPGLNPARPAPLLVLLHGAHGTGMDMLKSYRGDADRLGIVLVAPTAIAGTWDMIDDLRTRMGAEINLQPHYGKDLKALDAALADLFTRVAIDPARIGLLGFSDGATYALSVGTANPALFHTLIAYSPGPAFIADRPDRAQRIFVSHAKADPVLPYDDTASHVTALLRKHVAVTFRTFEGGHEVPPAIHAEALAFFMGQPAG